MANGTIAFDTLQTSGQITGTAKSVDTDYVVNGSAKHWVNYDAVDQATRGSLNQTSLTDHGTGDFSSYYTNNMLAAEDRCIFTNTYNTKNEGSSTNSPATRAGSNSDQAGDTSQSTTRVNFHTYYGSNATQDAAFEDHDGSYCATLGDLA